jgi:hypothetical protein
MEKGVAIPPTRLMKPSSVLEAGNIRAPKSRARAFVAGVAFILIVHPDAQGGNGVCGSAEGGLSEGACSGRHVEYPEFRPVW